MRTKTHFRVTAKASTLDPANRYCTCCEKRLSGEFVYLELDQRDGSYHDRGGVPADKSQGWFPFGKTCATKELRKATDQTFRIAQIIARRERNI